MNSTGSARIIGIRHVPRRPNRRFIEFDNGDSLSLDASLVTKSGLRVGLHVDLGMLAEVTREDNRIRAKSAALDMVRMRDVSCRQMRDRLRRKGFDDETMDYAIATLTKLGYLSDARFAAEFVASRSRRNPRGRFGLSHELANRGIDRDTIDRALTALSPTNERELAVRAATKQMPVYRTLPPDVAKRRLHDFLVRRGFAYDIVLSVMRELVGDVSSE